MTWSNKLAGLLLAALIMVLTIATSESAQAQTYTVCNLSNGPAQVCLWIDCGAGPFPLVPCHLLNPGDCVTWAIPPACVVVDVEVNGALYPVTPGMCLPLAPPNPPNRICFAPAGGIPDAEIH